MTTIEIPMSPEALTAFADRIVARCDIVSGPEPDAGNCLLWTGPLDRDGYGHVRHDGRAHLVHRLCWEMAAGRRLDRTEVLHHLCQRRACLAFWHMAPMTAAEHGRLHATLRRLGLTYTKPTP